MRMRIECLMTLHQQAMAHRNLVRFGRDKGIGTWQTKSSYQALEYCLTALQAHRARQLRQSWAAAVFTHTNIRRPIYPALRITFLPTS